MCTCGVALRQGGVTGQGGIQKGKRSFHDTQDNMILMRFVGGSGLESECRKTLEAPLMSCVHRKTL